MLFYKSDEEYKLFNAINNENTEKVKSILKKANNNNKKLNLNEIFSIGLYPLLCACDINNIEMVQMLIDYANKNSIILELNGKTTTAGDYPFLWSCYYNNIEMSKLLIDYANKNNIILKLNEKNKSKYSPLSWACEKNSIKMVKLLIDYSNKNNIILDLNGKDRMTGFSPLYWACYYNNYELVKLLINYSIKNNIIMEYEEIDYENNSKISNEISKVLKYYVNIIEIFIKGNYSVLNDNNTKIPKLFDYLNKNNIILDLNKKNKNENYLMLNACYINNIELVQSLIDYANKNNIILELNKTNSNGNYPLYWAFYNDNSKMIHLLINYANRNNIILKLNRSTAVSGDYPFLWTCYYNNIEMSKQLIEYANKNNIVLEVNKKNKKGNYPLHWACYYNNKEMVKLIINYSIKNNISLEYEIINYKNNPRINFEIKEILENYINIIEIFIKRNYSLLLTCGNNIKIVKLFDYANKNNIILDLNKKDKNGNYPISGAFYNNNIEIVKLFIDYANKNNIMLDINNIDRSGDYPITKACYSNNNEMVKLFMDYANKNDIVFDLNKKDKNGYYLISRACYNNNNEIVKLFMDYANKNNIILKLNEECHDGNYPLLWACYNNNIKILKLLIDYADQSNIILDLNKKNKNGTYPLYWAFYKNNIKMIQLLIDYANKNDIILEYDERDYERNLRIKTETIEVLNNYKKEKEYESQNMVIATDNFKAQKSYQLNLKKGEILIVTHWVYKNKGWVYGYRKNNKEEKGIFPEIFIKRCKNDNTGKNNLKREITPEFKTEFDRKIKMFIYQNKMNSNYMYGSRILEIYINRKNILLHSHNQMMTESLYELKNEFRIKYIKDEVIDSGGLLRDFFYRISKEIENPNYLLFKYSNTNPYELEINPISCLNPEFLNYFKIIGRILGLAIFYKQHLSVSFTSLFYKKLLNKPLEFSDIKLIDPEIYKNIKWLLENDGAENLGLYFMLNIKNSFGNYKIIELKPNGANIKVTDLNKYEYINLVINYILNNTNDKEQLEALKEGFYEIVPKNISETFDEFELKYLISGFNEINIEDWENNTDYRGFKKNDITIVYFWKCVREFNSENRKKLLSFATGNSHIPVTGFKDLQGNGKIQHFTINKAIPSNNQNDLPISHTCLNRIDLPPYIRYSVLKEKLLMAISEGMENYSME